MRDLTQLDFWLKVPLKFIVQGKFLVVPLDHRITKPLIIAKL
jgi:hypothetical protein